MYSYYVKLDNDGSVQCISTAFADGLVEVLSEYNEYELFSKIANSTISIENDRLLLVDNDPVVTYADMRGKEYPSIYDQLDAIWKGGDALAEMQARVMAVKEKYPKPS